MGAHQMDAYLYQGTLLCEECANAMANEIVKQEGNPTPEKLSDSNEWPYGPYNAGGGEADKPEHCVHCQIFLENPLTRDGVRYVREALVGYFCHDLPETIVGDHIITWAEFYADEIIG